MKNQNENTITWLTINNIVPLVTSIILMVLAFANLKSDVALLNQKIDIVITQQVKIISQYENVEDRYGALALKVNQIETEHAMNRLNK